MKIWVLVMVGGLAIAGCNTAKGVVADTGAVVDAVMGR